jgi:hypothetical protein
MFDYSISFLSVATQKIFDLTNLKRSDVFIDIGHGIGNAVIQAAVTVGCKSRGIELIEERYKVSCDFRDKFLEFINLEREKNNQVNVVCSNDVYFFYEM